MVFGFAWIIVGAYAMSSKRTAMIDIMNEIEINNLIQILSQITPRPGPEYILAEDTIKALHQSGITPDREVTLSHGRVDIKIGCYAIELKVKGSIQNVLKQLRRYAKDQSVENIILVTTSAKHLDMPGQIDNKPINIVYLPRL